MLGGRRDAGYALAKRLLQKKEVQEGSPGGTGVPRGLGKCRAGLLQRGAERHPRLPAMACQGGGWMDGWLREEGRNLSCLRKAPWLPTEHTASSPCTGSRGFTFSCPAASRQGFLHTHFSQVSERKHSALFP